MYKTKTMDSLDVTLPANGSPPDFDFNLPCRYFKSSFARSLSLNNSNNQCKSLDYDIRSNNNNNNISNNNNNNNNINSPTLSMTGLKQDVPPIPQKRSSPPQQQQQDGTTSSTSSCSSQNEANRKPVATTNSNSLVTVEVSIHKPPALPARRPLSFHATGMGMEQKMQTSLTQLRQQAFNQALNHSNAAGILPAVNGGGSAATTRSQQHQQFNQKLINHNNPASNGNGSSNNNNVSSVNNNNNGHFRRNIIVWPNKQNVEQDCNYFFDDGDDDEINSEYHDATKLSNSSDFNTTNSKHHPQQQHQIVIPTIMTSNVVHDNTTNVEAVILQNQVDTLHWQLKQVETSCDMYRAVMEEVARFLERYQKQRQLQQQREQQLLEQHIAAQNHENCIGSVEQIARSKSLYQVNATAGIDKPIKLDSKLTKDSNASYLRARSSTNLIDLKHCGKTKTNALGQQQQQQLLQQSKDDQSLGGSQSYSAFKDFTWRRSPKKAKDSRSNNGPDDVDEKLNQEAFRLLRTIHNLLSTSQHQPDIVHTNHQTQHQYQRHSLAPGTALHMGRITKAISSCSVATLPGAPLHNSTSLTLNSNCAGSITSESSAGSPNIAASSNTLAPEMLFLRAANMRDSRISLRSSTDSSVHSTSSAASSASSKLETDEEPATPFHSPPNMLAHKQHHLAGSSTEDESGFSSISSFPDIGVPLSSTMLSSTPNSKGRSVMGKELKTLNKDPQQQQQHHQQQLTTDSRNSTLKANVVGLPLNSSQDMSHRWDSPSKTYHNASTKFQRFSALSNEDSNSVLWV